MVKEQRDNAYARSSNRDNEVGLESRWYHGHFINAKPTKLSIANPLPCRTLSTASRFLVDNAYSKHRFQAFTSAQRFHAIHLFSKIPFQPD